MGHKYGGGNWSARLEMCQWRRETLDKGEHMGRGKKYQPEQVVNLLRQIEVAVANGKTTAQASKEAGIVEQTYFRWRKEYGGLQVDQAKRLKELEQENSKLKRLVANLSLDNLVLKDFASGNF
jgi:putative transposase